jgi:hypothetical protein
VQVLIVEVPPLFSVLRVLDFDLNSC